MIGRKKGLPKELAYEDMKDYIRCEMAAEFDARERWPEVLSKRQAERMEVRDENKTREQATASGALRDNREPKTAGFNQCLASHKP